MRTGLASRTCAVLVATWQVYQSVENVRDFAPQFVFVYTICGIVGSVLALVAVTILAAILFSQGIKAQSLQIRGKKGFLLIISW